MFESFDPKCDFCARLAAGDYDPKTADSYVVVMTAPSGHMQVVSRSHIHGVVGDPITAGFAMQKAAKLASGLGICEIATKANGTPEHLHLDVLLR